MGKIENRWRHGLSRREALLGLAGMLAGSPLLGAQHDPHPLRDHKRAPGLDEMMTAFEFEPICFANMPLRQYDYMAHGTDSEFTLRRNREAFDWVDLIEGPGASAEAVDTSAEVLGFRMDYPIMVAPSARQGDLHPDGEAGMYVGATGAGTPMIVANGPSVPIEEIAASADGPRWSQLYGTSNLEGNRQRIERFQAAGAQGVVVTIDQQASRFERDLHDRHLGGNPSAFGGGALTAPPSEGAARYRISDRRFWYSWEFLDYVRPLIDGPMLVKGILRTDDAQTCVERGYDGIIVSNHGGRSMDYEPSTLEVLPEIVDAVGGRIPVLIDSGFRRGSDVVKAIALGASAVCLGRAARWGLGAFGPAGVQRLLEILQAEFRRAMASTGRTTLAALDRTVVRTRFP